MQIMYSGIDIDELERVLAAGVDHAGNQIKAFVDDDGGWPLRCCLGDSATGDQLAIIGWTHTDVHGPFRETGPIVVHTSGCPGRPTWVTLPCSFEPRRMILRPYDTHHRIVYSSVVEAAPGEPKSTVVERLLSDPNVAFVHARHWSGGCWAFSARRAN